MTNEEYKTIRDYFVAAKALLQMETPLGESLDATRHVRNITFPSGSKLMINVASGKAIYSPADINLDLNNEELEELTIAQLSGRDL